jgi:hypothetical protein
MPFILNRMNAQRHVLNNYYNGTFGALIEIEAILRLVFARAENNLSVQHIVLALTRFLHLTLRACFPSRVARKMYATLTHCESSRI